jgi:hypothetical protein
MTPNEIAKSVAAAAHTWSPAAVTCADGSHPYFEIAPAMAAAGAPLAPAAYDAHNSVIFRTERWSMSARPEPKYVYEVAALAITSVFVRPDGHIVDADIEVNALDHEWANLDPGASSVGHSLDVNDLQTALTHEFGHFIGLDHTCYTPTIDPVTMMLKPRSKDDMEQDIPDCDGASQAVRDTVMFVSIDPGTITKRVLSSDEIRGVCETYSPGKDTHVCALDQPNDSMGCAVAGSTPGRDGRLALIAAALVLSLAAMGTRRLRV